MATAAQVRTTERCVCKDEALFASWRRTHHTSDTHRQPEISPMEMTQEVLKHGRRRHPLRIRRWCRQSISQSYLRSPLPGQAGPALLSDHQNGVKFGLKRHQAAGLRVHPGSTVQRDFGSNPGDTDDTGAHEEMHTGSLEKAVQVCRTFCRKEPQQPASAEEPSLAANPAEMPPACPQTHPLGLLHPTVPHPSLHHPCLGLLLSSS